MEGIFLIWILQALVMATIPAMIADSKGRDVVGWFFYGFLIWPIALVHALLISPADSVVCRFCTKHISREAIVCPYCQKDLVKEVNPKSKPNSQLDSKTESQSIKSNKFEKEKTIIIADSYRSKGKEKETISRKQESNLKENEQQIISLSEDQWTGIAIAFGSIVAIILATLILTNP